MTDKITNIGLEHFNNLTDHPKKVLEDLHEANQDFFGQVQNLIKETPEKTQKFLQGQQDKVVEFSQTITSVLKNNPTDWQSVGKIWFEFQTNQFTSYLQAVQKQNDEFQDIITTYSYKNPIVKETKKTTEDIKKHVETAVKTATKNVSDSISKPVHKPTKPVAKSVARSAPRKSNKPKVAKVTKINKTTGVSKANKTNGISPPSAK